MKNKYILGFFLMSVLATNAQTKETKEENHEELEEIVIYSQFIFPEKDMNEKASSSIYIDTKELRKYNYTDPNRVLMGRNGVSVIEEDGFGLRPNIILRGASSYRSSSINLMEDGILAAPAPYLAPAAYYFPTIGRMSGIEILKSSGQILYGPNTVGGSLNLISTQVPQTFSGNINLGYGSFDTKNIHLNVGDRIGKFGYLVEFYNGSSAGFKKLSRNQNTGFNTNDGVIKLLYDNSDAEIPNKLQFKLQTSSQLDNETYLGLTKEDFQKDPLQRYAASELDHMKNNHRQYVLSYEIKPFEKLSLNFDVYHNDFKRNWYKLNDIKVGDNNKVGLSKALSLSNTSDEIAVLKGNYTGYNTLYLRNNNRSYYSQGIQLNGNYQLTENGKLRFGSRFHQEEEDRFQWDDLYSSSAQGLSLVKREEAGSQANRISTAKASASYLQYQHTFDKLVLTGGLRYENISMNRKDYEKTDPNRQGAAKEKNNKVDVIIPGISALYNYNENGAIFASVHKGFAPPGITENQKPESSWNYELGTRFNNEFWNIEASAYVNNYSNILGADTNAVGGQTGQGDLYNAGAVLVKGVELYGKYTFNGKNSEVNFPISVNYTYFNSSFKKDFKGDVYGETVKGDELPFIPNHLLTVEAAANYKDLTFSTIFKYRGDVRNKVGQGTTNEKDLVPSVLLVDAVVRYQLSPKASFFVSGQNLLNKKYLATLNPAGYRPGMPLFVSVGTNVRF